MEYTITLRLEEDEHGYWGLRPPNSEEKFNSFWEASGVFHDVFEHYFEEQHKYFSWGSAFTIFGEMAASGHGLRYKELGINSFKYRTRNERDFIIDSLTYLQEYEYEVKNYEETYEPFSLDSRDCIIPRQKNIDCYNFNDWVGQFVELLEEKYKKTIPQLKKSSIINSYRWGYRQAEKIIGKDKVGSYDTLEEFLYKWDLITNTSPKKLSIDDKYAYGIRGFKFKVSNKRGKLKIKQSIVDEVNNLYPIGLLNY